jgi:SecD/SecF fusion protein
MKTGKSVLLIAVLLCGLLAFNSCKKKEGMDLKVMLSASQKDMLCELSSGVKDSVFTEALRLSDSLSAVDTGDYLTHFAKAWSLKFNDLKLNHHIAMQFSEKLSDTATNAFVISALRKEYSTALGKCTEVLKKRFEDFDLYDFSATLSDTLGLIRVDMLGVKDTARAMNLLKMRGALGFYEVYNYADVIDMYNRADALLSSIFSRTANAAKGDSNNPLVMKADSSAGQAVSDQEEQKKLALEHPLFYKLKLLPEDKGKTPQIGECRVHDTARINDLMALPYIQKLFPRDFKYLWTAVLDSTRPQYVKMIAVKTTLDNGPALCGCNVTSAECKEEEQMHLMMVNMEMNKEGTEAWARLTAANIGRALAIVVDDQVYSYPVVQSEIPGGKSQITGSFNRMEAEDLSFAINAGKMPLMMKVVELNAVKIEE